MADIQANSSLSDLLESIKDYDLNKRTYGAILKQMEAKNRLQSSDFEKLITLCLHEYKKKNTFGISSLKVLSCLLKKVDKEYNDSSQLVPVLVAVLDNLKVNARIVKITALKALCFEIVMLFPDECLITVAVDNAHELYTAVELYCHEPSVELVEQSILLTLKLLKILSADKKSKFVKDGIDTWFSTLIPTIFDIAKENSSGVNNALVLLVMLLKELLQHNYFENKHWKIFHSDLSSRYVPIISSILNDDREHWAPLWIVIVNLLKGGLTAGYLNALLQIEENAFKMDPKHRCLAFECWNSFIDNFTMQSSRILKRRIKFLAVPLLSHNAKSEATALAKFGTWWHFITRLCSKCDDIVNYIEHFLMFCFGAPSPANKPLAPGLFSDGTKRLAIQAFAKILGPCDCLCFGDLEPLEVTLVTAEHLVKNNKNWSHYFQTALESSVELEEEELSRHLGCAWKSYLIKIGGGLSNEAFRKEKMFSKLLEVLQKSLQKCCFKTSQIIITKLLPAVFELDKQTLTMLFDGEAEVLETIQGVFTDSSNNNFYLSCDIDGSMKSVGLYTDYAISNTSSGTLDNFLEKLPSSESGILLWACFVESTKKHKYLNSQWMTDVIIWPIKQNVMSNVEKYTSTWISLYDSLASENARNELNANIIHTVNNKLLLLLSGNKSTSTPFKLASIISLMKQVLNEKGEPQKPEHLVLKILAKQMSEELSPTLYLHLIDCLTRLLRVFVVHRDAVDAKKLLLVTNGALKATPRIFSTIKSDSQFLEPVEMLLESLHDLMEIEQYSKSSSIIIDGVKEVASSELSSALSNPVKRIVSLLKSACVGDKDVKALAKKFSPESTVQEAPNNAKEQSTTPCKKSTPSRNIKKSAKIVNTIVENGEEFVQIESDWKFNPKKMTENQLEKWQRKREDIPALYQDLSQSQDDIKLRTWKADSNDTTCSKSDDSAAFPGIVSETTKESPKSPSTSNGSKATPKTRDAPQTLLKSRVSRNVKDLLNKDNVTQCLVVCEKIPDEAMSAVSKPNAQVDVSIPRSTKEPDPQTADTNPNPLESRTPSSKTTERPSRRKKTPSKFNDSKIFGTRKRINLGSFKGETTRVDRVHIDTTEPARQNSESLRLADDKAPKSPDEQVDRCVASAPNKDLDLEMADTRVDKKDDAPSKNANANGATASNLCPKVNRRSGSKESRIQRLLAIDMLEPTIAITKIDSGPYATRKKLKLTNNAKSTENESAVDSQPLPDSASQDVIESSQDSSVTAMSAISTRLHANNGTVPSAEKEEDVSASDCPISGDGLLMSDEECDSLLPENKTVLQPSAATEELPGDSEATDADATILTEHLDTEPVRLEFSAQNTAEADTQPVNFVVDVIKEEIYDSLLNKEDDLANLSSARGGAEAPPPTPREDASSPLRDREQRRKDFLNDTLEISPIRTMSSLVLERTPSPETSADFVVIDLATPVLLNGEPAAESPEVFSEERPSPDRQAGLGLKRPRVRAAGRAAQMLGLCADADEAEEADGCDEAGEPFLRLKRHLPGLGSPRGPILKRKHAEIAEDAAPSPATKRKRVSFHDPPVSTLVCVRKYIGPGDSRSPRSPKSQRRLDKALARTVESILSDEDAPSGPSDRTPPAEVGDPADLDDREPLFPRPADCEDPVENIASALSSSDVRRPPVEALEGRVSTVGDLARATEREVNGPCIKTPKVEVARRALQPYGARSDAAKERQKPSDAETQTEQREGSPRAVQTEGVGFIRDSDVAQYVAANPDVIEAFDERTLEALSEALISRVARDKDRMAAIVVQFLKEKFEAKSAISYWCEILQKISDKP